MIINCLLIPTVETACNPWPVAPSAQRAEYITLSNLCFPPARDTCDYTGRTQMKSKGIQADLRENQKKQNCERVPHSSLDVMARDNFTDLACGSQPRSVQEQHEVPILVHLQKNVTAPHKLAIENFTAVALESDVKSNSTSYSLGFVTLGNTLGSQGWCITCGQEFEPAWLTW
ncbi:hypothetical protein AAY473_027248 [Plecturocebus cupreus]